MTRSFTTPRGRILLREAKPADAVPYRELRLEALRDSPTAFSADYQTNLRQPPDYWKERLTLQPEEATIYLALHEGNLIGMTGIVRGSSPKTRHAALIWGVYVKPEWRGLHIAGELVSSCLDWARARNIILLRLAVSAANQPAIRCYERSGFKTYGTEPRAIYYEGTYYDEYLMYHSLENKLGP